MQYDKIEIATGSKSSVPWATAIIGNGSEPYRRHTMTVTGIEVSSGLVRDIVNCC